MTIASSAILALGGTNQQSWATELDSTSATPLEKKGSIRFDSHPIFGLRGFQYVRFDQSGGVAAGELQSFRDIVSVANISSGTTTSITTSGLTADIYVDGLLYCLDDAGGAGAAPEGEVARIVKNTTTVITVHSSDAFSVAPAVNDDFQIILPWAVVDSADGDFAGQVAGVVMTAQDQYDYGWVQFLGVHPAVNLIAAGTALPIYESLVADAALLTDGAGDAVDLRVGRLMHGVSSDTVARKAIVQMFCGSAFQMGNSTA